MKPFLLLVSLCSFNLTFAQDNCSDITESKIEEYTTRKTDVLAPIVLTQLIGKESKFYLLIKVYDDYLTEPGEGAKVLLEGGDVLDFKDAEISFDKAIDENFNGIHG
jgi:hypothetical protein